MARSVLSEVADRPTWIVVSSELTAILDGRIAKAAPAPADPLLLLFDLQSGGPATLQLSDPVDDEDMSGSAVSLLLARAAFIRLGGSVEGLVRRSFHLPAELRAVVLALQGCTAAGEVAAIYRAAKAVELACEVIRLLGDGALTPIAAESGLSLADSRRLLAARQLIDERWGEALTLEQIGRACGLNRAKLTRGFRSLFDCSVTEALTERRLTEARQLLATTDLPVSLVAYRSGYQSNASFARAFGRRFGVPPTSYRERAFALAA